MPIIVHRLIRNFSKKFILLRGLLVLISKDATWLPLSSVYIRLASGWSPSASISTELYFIVFSVFRNPSVLGKGPCLKLGSPSQKEYRLRQAYLLLDSSCIGT